MQTLRSVYLNALSMVVGGLCLVAPPLVFGYQSDVVTQPHIEVSLLSELQQVSPGSTFYIGLSLELEHHWHVYWKNPGDSGMAPTIEWRLPEGLSAASIAWPKPEKIPVASLLNYGYQDSVLLPVAFTLSEDYSGKTMDIEGNASWLVCKEVCIPGNASLKISLDVGEKKVSPSKARIDQALSVVPKTLGLMSGTIKEQGDDLSIELYAAKKVFVDAKKIEVFIADSNLVDYAAKSQLRWKNNYLSFGQSKSATFHKLPQAVSGVFVIDDQQAWEFAVSQ